MVFFDDFQKLSELHSFKCYLGYYIIVKPSFCQKNPSTYSNFRTDLNLSFRKKGAPLWYKRTPLILSSLFWAASSNFSRSVLLSSEVHPSTTSVKWLENKSKPSIILLSYYFLGLGLPLPAPPSTWFSSPLVYPSKTRSWPFCYAFTLGFIFRSFYTLHNGHLFCPLWVCSPVSIRAGLVWLAGGWRHCGRWAGARRLLGWCGVTLEGNIIIMACGFYAFSHFTRCFD